MSVNFASASQPIEWLPLDVVERILNLCSADVLSLVQSGKLRARNVQGGEARIDSASLDAYTATRPLVHPAPPPTYVRHGNGYRLEV